CTNNQKCSLLFHHLNSFLLFVGHLLQNPTKNLLEIDIFSSKHLFFFFSSFSLFPCMIFSITITFSFSSSSFLIRFNSCSAACSPILSVGGVIVIFGRMLKSFLSK